MNEDRELIRLLLEAADDLEAQGFLGMGLLRRAARRIAECRCQDDSGFVCPRCGESVTQPALGRRRVYCTDRCRWAASKEARNARVVA